MCEKLALGLREQSWYLKRPPAGVGVLRIIFRRRHDAFMLMEYLPKFLKEAVVFFNEKIEVDLELGW